MAYHRSQPSLTKFQTIQLVFVEHLLHSFQLALPVIPCFAHTADQKVEGYVRGPNNGGTRQGYSFGGRPHGHQGNVVRRRDKLSGRWSQSMAHCPWSTYHSERVRVGSSQTTRRSFRRSQHSDMSTPGGQVIYLLQYCLRQLVFQVFQTYYQLNLLKDSSSSAMCVNLFNSRA